MTISRSIGIAVFAAALVAWLAAYMPESHKQSQSGPQAVSPEVSVARVIHRSVTEWDEFTGRLQAPESVELRPRVSGYIADVNLQEGEIVTEGELLFQIDSRPFAAEVARLRAELVSAKSALALAQTQFTRAEKLVSTRAIAREELDNRKANLQQARASVDAVSAALSLAQLNLDYTRVTAPISGRVSNALVTRGNHVNAGDSVLTTIVSTDKVYAYFDADEQTYLNYAKLAKAGSRPSARESRNPVSMALANDLSFPHEGYIDFVDNQVDPQSGTIRGRAVFDNREGQFIPGLFARIRLIGSASYDGILIDDKAVGTDLNNKFVLVLDDNNAVQYRSVVLGEKLAGLRIIKSGLAPGDVIVVNGLQRVRPGTEVSPQQVSMTSDDTLQELHALQVRVERMLNAQRLASDAVLSDHMIVGG